MGVPSPIMIYTGFFASSAMTLSYLATLCSGAQSVTADMDAQRSDGTDKRKGV